MKIKKIWSFVYDLCWTASYCLPFILACVIFTNATGGYRF